MALDVTIKDQSGKVVFSREKEYTVGDYYFGKKQVPLAEWDITAMEHIDLGLKPGKPDTNTFIVNLPDGTTAVDVEANLIYIYSTDEKPASIQKLTQHVNIVK